MARNQFKVTFTNAQPGAPVSVLTPSPEHVYSSATATKPVGGKQLYLDGTNTITIWSDAQDVIVSTLDGVGSGIQGTATVASPTVTVSDGTPPASPPGSAAYVGSGLVAAPANPAVGQEYFSAALADVRFPPSQADRRIAITPPSWSSTAMQEPTVIELAGTLHMLYTGNTGVGYATCPSTSDPTNPANWTLSGTGPVIGNGQAGVAGLVNHGNAYVEGNTVYYFANVPADNTVKCWTAATSDLTTWTLVGTVLAKDASWQVIGNVAVVKDGANYRMLVEYKIAGVWHTGMASCATVSGTYALTVARYVTLEPDTGDRATAGGPGLTFENGQWVVIYHAGIVWNGLTPTAGYRATSADLTVDAWTLTDNGQPVVRRVHANEVDQVADLCVIRLASGDVYGFWSGVDNRATFTSRIIAARLSPVRKRWNGTVWRNVEATSQDSSDTARLPAKTRYVELVGDFAGTATAWAQITDGTTPLSFTVAPSGTDLIVRMTGVFSPTGSVGFKYWFRVNRGGGTEIKTLGAVNGTGGNRINVSMECRFTKLTPGKYYGFSIEYQIDSGGGTLNCRPVALVGQEQASATAIDAAYPF